MELNLSIFPEWQLVIVFGLSLIIVLWPAIPIVKSRQTHQIWRYVLFILAVLSILLAFIKPAIKTNKIPYATVILTQDYRPGEFDSLKNIHDDLKVIHYNEEEEKGNESFYNWLLHQKEASRTFILGSGLRESDLKKLQSCNIKFMPGQIPEGVVDLEWPQQVTAGESFRISGVINHPDSSVRLALKGPFGEKIILDKTSPGVDSFSVSAGINTPGNYLLELYLVTGKGGKVWSGNFPVSVLDLNLPSILVVENSPSFEINYLKQHLAEQGLRVALRRQVSQDISHEEFINLPERALSYLDKVLLDQFDLFILEIGALSSLHTTELRNLHNRIAEGGTLLVEVLSDWPGHIRNSNLFFPHLNELLSPVSPTMIHIDGTMFGIDQEFSATVSMPGIRKGAVGFPDNKRESNHLLAYKPIETGQILVHIFPVTYQIRLEGKMSLYHMYWNLLFQEMTNMRYNQSIWNIQRDFPLTTGDPVLLGLTTNSENPTAEMSSENSDYPVYFINSYWHPNVWHGTNWPVTIGWHRITEKGTEEYQDLYVFGEAEARNWKPLQTWQRTQRNNLFFTRQQQNSDTIPRIESLKRIPSWIFFVCFLIFVTSRWILEKLHSG